jgi:hypothetical protein
VAGDAALSLRVAEASVTLAWATRSDFVQCESVTGDRAG